MFLRDSNLRPADEKYVASVSRLGAVSSCKVFYLQVFRRIKSAGMYRYMPHYVGPVVVKTVVNVRPDDRTQIALLLRSSEYAFMSKSCHVAQLRCKPL